MAKLLFITQRVDKDDGILGTYHRWIEALAEKVGQINVICLYKGRLELPDNVRVFSLGKESWILDLARPAKPWRSGRSWISEFLQRLRYIVRFYRYIWRLRHEYDVVFVHMNPVYIVLGGWFWKLTRKKLFLWYNHPLGNLTAKIGIKLADKVFCTSPYSFPAKYKKTSLMPAGIDADFFKKNEDVDKKNNRILYLGRISPIKHIDCLIKAGQLLDARNINFEILIIGSPSSRLDRKYEQELKQMAKRLVGSGKIIFKSSMPNYGTPGIYNSSQVFINLTPTGSFDKTILEAMACQALVLVSNKMFVNLFNKEIIERCVFAEENSLELAVKIESLLLLPMSKKVKMGQQLRKIVVKHHSLTGLVNQLAAIVSF